MAGRRVCINNNKAVAVAMAVALLALLFAAGEAEDCNVNVNVGTVMTQCKSCKNGTPSQGCCDALRNANFDCLCRKFWDQLKGTSYAKCAEAIPSKCNLPKAKCH